MLSFFFFLNRFSFEVILKLMENKEFPLMCANTVLPGSDRAENKLAESLPLRQLWSSGKDLH